MLATTAFFIYYNFISPQMIFKGIEIVECSNIGRIVKKTKTC